MLDGEPVTISRVRAAAKRIRDDAERPGDREVVNGFRRLFQDPMLKTRTGLASFVRTLGLESVDLTQRLKRFDRIVGKLRRHRSMQVVTMQDIGGCRLVVPTLEEQDALAQHIRSVWDERLHEVYDYVSSPKASG